MLWVRVNRVVNIMVVSRIASTATRFRPRLARNIRCVSTGMGRKIFFFFCTFTVLHLTGIRCAHPQCG